MSYFLESTPLLKAFLLAAVRDAHDADDLFQEVSSVLWEKFATFDSSLPFSRWALGVARLEVLNWRRKSAQGHTLLSEEALELLSRTAEEPAPLIVSRREHLRACLKKLPAHGGEVVRLRYQEGLRIQDLAARLGKSVAAMEMMLVRIRRLLRECIERLDLREAAR